MVWEFEIETDIPPKKSSLFFYFFKELNITLKDLRLNNENFTFSEMAKYNAQISFYKILRPEVLLKKPQSGKKKSKSARKINLLRYSAHRNIKFHDINSIYLLIWKTRDFCHKRLISTRFRVVFFWSLSRRTRKRDYRQKTNVWNGGRKTIRWMTSIWQTPFTRRVLLPSPHSDPDIDLSRRILALLGSLTWDSVSAERDAKRNA